MNPYTEKLKTAIAAYETNCGISPADSILEALWYDYSCGSPVDDGHIRTAEAALAPVFEELSVVSSDTLFDLITDQVTAYQRAAYLDGLRMGVHLMEELA